MSKQQRINAVIETLLANWQQWEAEAGQQARCPEHCLAVHIDFVSKITQVQPALLNDGRTLKKLKRLSGRKVTA